MEPSEQNNTVHFGFEVGPMPITERRAMSRTMDSGSGLSSFPSLGLDSGLHMGQGLKQMSAGSPWGPLQGSFQAGLRSSNWDVYRKSIILRCVQNINYSVDHFLSKWKFHFVTQIFANPMDQLCSRMFFQRFMAAYQKQVYTNRLRIN